MGASRIAASAAPWKARPYTSPGMGLWARNYKNPGLVPGFSFLALPAAYWMTTLKLMLKDGAVLPVLPVIMALGKPVKVNWTLVTVLSTQGTGEQAGLCAP